MGRKGLEVIFLRRGTAALAAALLVGGLAQTVGPTSAGAVAGNFGAKPTNASGNGTSGTNLFIHSSATSGVVQTSPVVYLVVWGNQWGTGPRPAVTALEGLFQGLFTTKDSWGKILDQYCQGIPSGTSSCTGKNVSFINPQATPQGGVYGGTFFDTVNPAPSRATTAQIAAEAVAAATHFGNTSSTPNLNAQYVILSPPGTHPDGFPQTKFCGWHSSTQAFGGKLSYTNLPYVPDLGTAACTTETNPGPLDGYESTETHEFAESATDPFPSTGWLSKTRAEMEIRAKTSTVTRPSTETSTTCRACGRTQRGSASFRADRLSPAAIR